MAMRIVPTPVRRALPAPVRKVGVLAIHWHHVRRRPRLALRYLLTERETNNFTYQLGNPGELAEFLAAQLGTTSGLMLALIQELDADEELRRLLSARLTTRP